MTIYSLDILLPDLKPACCSISSSNCCFLTCIQISQEAGQEVWYSHLFKNFPEFAVIHSPLPEKFIFILKDNRNSFFFYIIHILLCLFFRNTLCIHPFELIKLLWLFAYLLLCAPGECYEHRNLSEMPVQWIQRKVNGAFCWIMIW